MIKKLLLVATFVLATFTTILAQNRGCGTPSHQYIYQNGSQEVRDRMDAIEKHTHQYIENLQNQGPFAIEATGVITIPVVVHVVFNTAAQNISDAIIQSQIDVLNADFRRTNADRTNTPAAFTGVAADFEIQFALATRTPQGSATNGIVRRQTTRTFFEFGGSDPQGVFVKQSSQGGSDAWDVNSYLNMWVCNFGGASANLLGYATFPTDAGTFRDGVVMGYKYFGVNPSLGGVYGYGRTCTHEVGHWLNLRHIWGDANCGNDFVADTPTQQTSNGGCPTFPRRTCGNTTNGDMFMNYMDYTNDQCMNLFTTGQKARGRALFEVGGARAILLSSQGLVPPASCPVSLATPAGLASSAITSTTATVAWGAVASATSYTVNFRALGATTWSSGSVASTSASLTGLSASTTYEYRVQAVCGSTLSAFSATSTFVTTAATVSYCASRGNSVADEWIDLVRLGSINRTSGADAGYFNGTALATTIARGSSQTITYSAGFRAGYSAREHWAVWIDWNRDGDFLDTGEQIVSRNSTSAASLSTTFTVPTTASLGTTRMRVSMKWNANPTSCETFSFGEVEDYTVNVSATARFAQEEFTAAPEAKVSIEVYPNPAIDETTIQINAERAIKQVNVVILNAQGQEVSRQTIEVNAEANTTIEERINLQGLKNGLYFLNLEADGIRQVRKLMIAK